MSELDIIIRWTVLFVFIVIACVYFYALKKQGDATVDLYKSYFDLIDNDESMDAKEKANAKNKAHEHYKRNAQCT